MATVTAARAVRAWAIPFSVGAAAVQLALTLPLAAALNIWQDEAYTIHSAAGGVAYAFHEALAFEQNAPLYFAIMALWQDLNASPFFLRLFSVACIAVTVVLTPALCRRYSPSIDARWVTAAVAINPFAIWCALEIRVYALVVLMSAALLLTFYDAFLAGRPAKRSWLAYGILCALALYTQYYLAFLIAAQGAYLLFARRGALLRYLVAAGAAGIAFVPLLAAVPGQMANFRGIFAAPSSPAAAAATLGSIIARYLFPTDAIAHPIFFYALLVAAMAASVMLARRAFVRNGPLPVAAISIVAWALFAVALYLTHEHVLNRHAASLFIPFELTLFSLCAFLREPLAGRAVRAIACIAIALSAAGLFANYRYFAKPGDWKRVTAYISQHERPGEPIAVFQAENALPLAYYYRGPNRIVSIPHAVDFHKYDVAAFVVRSSSDLQASMPAQKNIWLISAGECASANVQFGCPQVEKYVTDHYKTLVNKGFFGARVRFLQRLAAPSPGAR